MENIIISIYLKTRTINLLKKEIKIFHLETNLSSLIKKIITNHYPSYEKTNKYLKNQIKKSIEYSDNFNDKDLDNIVWSVQNFLSNVNEFSNQNDIEKNYRKKISLRINKNDFEFTSIIYNSSQYLSTFINAIILSYLNKPQQTREKILFKDINNKIETAINNSQVIEIMYKTTYQSKIKNRNVIPYKLSISREELYNYLLYQENKENKKYAKSIHLYNIVHIRILDQHEDVDKNVLKNFNKMELNGVQFSINEDVKYKILLSEEGKKIFNYCYLERPYKLSETDETNGIYYFNCSELQLFRYFAPFFKNAIILEPYEVNEKFKKYIQESLSNYN